MSSASLSTDAYLALGSSAESFEDDVVEVSGKVAIQSARRCDVFLWLFTSTGCRSSRGDRPVMSL